MHGQGSFYLLHYFTKVKNKGKFCRDFLRKLRTEQGFGEDKKGMKRDINHIWGIKALLSHCESQEIIRRFQCFHIVKTMILGQLLVV